MKVLAKNKRATFDFEITSKTETGIVLFGWEVKSAKNNLVSLKGSYVKVIGEEMFLSGARISKWKYATQEKIIDEQRDRKLLLQKRQIKSLKSKAQEKGMTIVPIDMYTNSAGLVKVTIALGKGKKKYDKRETLKMKDLKRRINQERASLNL